MIVACDGETALCGSIVNYSFCAERESTARRAAQGVRKSSPATPAISLGSFVASGFSATRGAGPFKSLGGARERHSDETLHFLGQSTRPVSALGTLVHMPQQKGPDHQSNPAEEPILSPDILGTTLYRPSAENRTDPSSCLPGGANQATQSPIK